VPRLFDGTSDLEEFIKDCCRFFEVTKIGKKDQINLTRGFIVRDLLPMYEAIQDGNFDERLRKAFQKPSSLMRDFMNLAEYRKEEDAEVYFRKVETLVDNVLRHKFEKTELMQYFLVHCLNDKETAKEIKLRDAVKEDTIKEVIKKMDSIKEDNNVAAVQRETFANKVKKNLEVPYQRQDNRRDFKTQGSPRNRIDYLNDNRKCYNCNKEGHISRDCRLRKVPTCFGCGKVGHIKMMCPEKRDDRRQVNNGENRNLRCYGCQQFGHKRNECPNISCKSCGRNGHFSHQCSNMYRTYAGNRFQYSQGSRDNLGNERDGFRNYNRMRNNVAVMENEDKEYCYPNEEAPLRDEVIGAMH
jgi:hypothetical protein